MVTPLVDLVIRVPALRCGVCPIGMRWRGGVLAVGLPGHDHGGGPEHHGLVVLGAPLVVADQAAVPAQPAEGAFDDPPAGKHDEPAQCRRCA